MNIKITHNPLLSVKKLISARLKGEKNKSAGKKKCRGKNKS
jgi:hypothetical protein